MRIRAGGRWIGPPHCPSPGWQRGPPADPQPRRPPGGWHQGSKAKKADRTGAGPSLVLQAAAELPPAPLPSPAAGLEAEGLQLVPEGFMVHGPVVLGLTEGLGQDGRIRQCGGVGTFRGNLPSPLATGWLSPFPAVQPSREGSSHPDPRYRVLWEELLIAALEDIHLRVVEAGVVVGSSVAFPDETAPGTSRGVGVRAGWCGRIYLRGPVLCTHAFVGLGEPQKA